MKKATFNILVLITFFTYTTFTSLGQVSNLVKADKLWESADVLLTSESACYNPDTKEIYVSCINGSPLEKDGNGFIAKLSLAGEIIIQKWITGMDAPKGMGISDGFLFVTDIDRILKINIKDERIVKEYKVGEAKFLNDITVGPTGNVYVSDMSTFKIYRIIEDNIEMYFEHDQIIKPNGLNFEDDNLLIGTKNGIFILNIKDKELKNIVKNTGSIDGLEPDGHGNYIISDWSGKVQFIKAGMSPIEIINTTDNSINAADIEYITDRKLLLVPTFFNNRLAAYTLDNK